MAMGRVCCFFRNCGIPCFIICIILLIVIIICNSTVPCKKEKFNPNITSSKLFNKTNLDEKEYLCFDETVNVIPDKYFKDLKKLKRIDFKGDISYLGKNAFSGCENLEEINFYEKLDYYDSDVFKKLEKLKRLYFQDIRIIRENTFAELSSLDYVTIKSGLEFIENGAFKNCEKLKGLKIPAPLPTIENDSIDDSVSTDFIYQNFQKVNYGQMVFWNNSCIKSLIIPDNFKELSKWMFAFCSSLEYVEIPASISKINKHCFSACSNIREINYHGYFKNFVSIYPAYNVELNSNCRIKTLDFPNGKIVIEP